MYKQLKMNGWKNKKKIECPKKIMVIKKIEQTEINSKNSPELAVVEQKKKKQKKLKLVVYKIKLDFE